MDTPVKNKKKFDYIPILIFPLVIAVGFFSAKSAFSLLFKRHRPKPVAMNTPVANTQVVSPGVKPVSITPVSAKPVIAKSVPVKPAVERVPESVPEQKIVKKIVTPEPNMPVVSTSDETLPDLSLNGIAFSEQAEEMSYALINNKIVKVGEKVSGALVTRISKNTVELKTQGSRIITLIQKK